MPAAPTKRFDLPNPGLGLGLRSKHHDYIREHRPQVDWFEIISENVMDAGGRSRRALEEFREHYPMVMHGVSLSIGSTDPLDMAYLGRLKALRDSIGALWVSDHLCWTGVLGEHSHQLLPLPYTEEVLKLCAERVRIVQDFMEAPLLLENPSSYLEFNKSTMHEADFMSALATEADCALLLDVNNIYVSAFNHDLDAFDYVDRIPHDRVVQYHLAGHSNKGDYILDTHSDHVIDEVWQLFAHSYAKTSGAAVMVEWDDEIPEFEVLFAEVNKARAFMHDAQAEVNHGRD